MVMIVLWIGVDDGGYASWPVLTMWHLICQETLMIWLHRPIVDDVGRHLHIQHTHLMFYILLFADTWFSESHNLN